jgi:hypothetical protein
VFSELFLYVYIARFWQEMSLELTHRLQGGRPLTERAAHVEDLCCQVEALRVGLRSWPGREGPKLGRPYLECASVWKRKQLERKSDEVSDRAFLTLRERGKEIPLLPPGTT